MKKNSLYFSQNRYARLIIPGTSAIFLGGMIYLLFHSSESLFFSGIRSSGLDNWLTFTRNSSLGLSPYLPSWGVYSLPDGLWAFSYSLFMTGIWWNSGSRLKYLWIATIPLLVLGSELLQLNSIIPGTFCVQDLILEILGITTGMTFAIKTPKPHNHETSFN